MLDRQDVTGSRPEQVLPRGLAYAPQGRNRFEGTGAALLADPDVKRLYLGG